MHTYLCKSFIIMITYTLEGIKLNAGTPIFLVVLLHKNTVATWLNHVSSVVFAGGFTHFLSP